MELNQDLRSLLEKYAAGEISPEERTSLYRALTEQRNESEFKTIMQQLAEQTKHDASYNEEDWTGVIRSILEEKAERPILRPLHKIWVRAAAAAVIIGLSFGTYFFLKPKPQTETAKNQNQKIPDIAPGTNKATLTLGNGKTLVLDSQAVGTLAQQGNTKISKTDSGQLAYTLDKSNLSKNKSVDNQLNNLRKHFDNAKGRSISIGVTRRHKSLAQRGVINNISNRVRRKSTFRKNYRRSLF